jgi:4-amino-4-deoxy-L-arabinose transferase-like glycosyltransferase
MFSEKIKNNSYVLYLSVIILVVFRLLLIAEIPLLDKTEARYAEISRIMMETKEWTLLQIDYDVPFMAKPPLSSWLSAGSFLIFGVNEFASRFPSFLLNILILVILGKIVKKSGASFYLPGFILLTMPEFLIHTGVVSTDTTFAFCTTIAMLSFWKAMNESENGYWKYLFFIGLGFGLLAKGPLVIVLTSPPLFVWCLLEKKRISEIWSKLPWITGFLIAAIIAVPWYYLAEQKSPGFIDYFIVGEHFKRFLVPHWKGDLYGNPKSFPLGMIWVFVLAFGFPWVQIVFYKIWQNRKVVFKNSWVSFLVLWFLWTPIFFSIARNILHTYMLPVTVPIALLMVYWWDDFPVKKTLFRVSLAFPFLVLIAYFSVFATGKIDHYINSDKYLLENLNVKTVNKNVPLFYWKVKNYSGQFYSEGKAMILKNETELDSVLKVDKKIFFVIPKDMVTEIPPSQKGKLVLVQDNYKTLIFSTKSN